MGLCNNPEIFQEKMSELFVGLDTVCVYINEIVHITKVSHTEHINILKDMFTRLHNGGLKFNARKIMLLRLQN